jgi:prepilin-type N-terminal cleavage/methylation domain-containing protein
MTRAVKRERGFTLLELLIATAIFMVICAAMFSLLELSQQKYATETQMSGSFQEARLGLDQIVRDINISGYPSQSMFANTTNTASYAVAPFAWDPGYATTPNCTIPCAVTPTDKDLIIETYLPSLGTVSWIHYQLAQNTNGETWTLYRGIAPKTAGSDPYTATTAPGVMTPLVNNVVNYTSGTVLALINSQYPNMFPGGVQPPLFSYTCMTPTGTQPCSSAGNNNAPAYVSDVDITLIVMAPYQDMQTQSLKLIELTGRGHRTTFGN